MRFPTFDITGWHERQRSETNIVWTSDEGDSLTFNVSETKDMVPLSNQEVWRSLGRPIAEGRGGSMVSGDSFEEEPAPLFQLIYERKDGNGHMYGAPLFLPLRDTVLVIGAGCREHGVTGVREALVTSQLAEEGRPDIDRFQTPDATGAHGTIRNWFRDPYDPEYPGPVLRCMADDEEHDALVPHHPLSRLRRTLLMVRRTLRFDDEAGPPDPAPRPGP